MVYCSNCNAEVPDEATGCPECGATFVEESTTDETAPSIYDRLPVRSIAIAAGGLSAFALLLQLIIPVLIGFRPMTPPWQPIFFLVLWGGAVAGVWVQTHRGYTVAAIIFALGAVWSGLAYFMGPGVRLGPLGEMMAVDPVSLLVGTIYTLQGVTQSRGQLGMGLLRFASVVGTLFSGAIAAIIWQTRQRSISPSPAEGGVAAGTQEQPSTLTQYASLVFLCGSVLFVIIVPLAGFIGTTEALRTRAIVAAFPSLLTAVLAAVQVTQSSMSGQAINTPLAVVLGTIVPIALTFDLVYMRRKTDWNPNRLLYPLGAVLVWFIAVPVYLYRRYKAMANFET
jgi:hypothetical protein